MRDNNFDDIYNIYHYHIINNFKSLDINPIFIFSIKHFIQNIYQQLIYSYYQVPFDKLKYLIFLILNLNLFQHY